MENLYSTFKKLKDRISPNKTTNNASESVKGLRRKRSISSSEDNPFTEKLKKVIVHNDDLEAPYVLNDAENADRSKIESPFIRNENLSKVNEHSKKTREVTPVDEKDSSGSSEHVRKKEVTKQPNRADEARNAEERNVRETSEPVETNTDDDDEEEDKVSLDVLVEMNKLEECFPVLSANYRLIDKIGEGTFSTVYKAEALNGTIKLGSEIWKSPPLKRSKVTVKAIKKKNPIVALKQIYVTSSPTRIYNELNLLYILTGNSHVAPLLDVLRYQDQVLAILPYYQHSDFRDFYRDLPVKGIKKYLWELFHALDFVHDKEVIHRDLKPTNFLYDPFKGRGVLVDFGLAEKMETSVLSRNSNACPCMTKDKPVVSSSHAKRLNVKAAYPKQDQRPPRRANRAGTRGFRAPEVLFKCTNQSTKLDIWSAGIIGLSLISRKFPLFNSPDDTDALFELAVVFGMDKLQKCAELHGCGLEIALTKNDNKNYTSLLKIIADFLNTEWLYESLPSDSVAYDTLRILNEAGDAFQKPTPEEYTTEKTMNKALENYNDHKHLLQLLHGCLNMDPNRRLSSKDILNLAFFEELRNARDDEVIF